MHMSRGSGVLYGKVGVVGGYGSSIGNGLEVRVGRYYLRVVQHVAA